MAAPPDTKPKTIAASKRDVRPSYQQIAVADPDAPVRVVMKLRPRNPLPDPAQLGATPPLERPAPMSYDEYVAQYGATPSDVDAVVSYAQAHKLAVVEASAAKRMVIVTGSVKSMSQAFGVEFWTYESAKTSRTYRGTAGPVYMPDTLCPIVTAVAGFDTRRQVQPGAAAPTPGAAAPAPVRPRRVIHTAYTPPQVAQLYSFPPQLDGTGQCIGLLEFAGGFVEADLEVYFRKIGVKQPSIAVVSVDGTQNSPGTHHDGEVMLDIEVAGGAAPGAKLAVYFAQNTEAGWLEAITAAVHDTTNRPSVISISWGYTEFEGDMLAWSPQVIEEWNRTLQEAAQLNITVVAAAGDDGSINGVQDGKVHVDFPASSPYVLACGGTSLLGKNGGIVDEFVWMDGLRRQGGSGTTGGGVSEHVPRPAWQSDPALKIPASKSTAFVGRGVPDVAANADPRTGYIVRVDGWDAIDGGTSAAAPMWAALIARINQELAKTAGGRTVGFLNPLLYSKLGGTPAFRDIVSGTNDALGNLGAYNAGPGWDACTGWGSPHGINLLAALTGTPAAVTDVAPDEHPGLAEVLGTQAKLTADEELKVERAKVRQLIETVHRLSKLLPNT